MTDLHTKGKKLYMNPVTGSIGEYEDWSYDEGDWIQNAVDDGDVIEVVKDQNGDWVPA